jgi:hypothetical protein
MAATTASRGVVWMPPEMPAHVTKSRYFFVAPGRDRSEGSRTGPRNRHSPAGARATRATSFPFFFHASAAPSIVDAKPPPPHHHHRSLPTGCPRRPARHPSRRRTQQHPPLHVAASSAATPRQLPSTFQQRPPHPTLAVAAPTHSAAAAASYETDATKQTPPQPCRKPTTAQ